MQGLMSVPCDIRSRPYPIASSLHDFIQNRQTIQRTIRKLVFFPMIDQPVSLDTKSNGGAGRDRTDDPLLAKQVLSQLSYGPY